MRASLYLFICAQKCHLWFENYVAFNYIEGKKIEIKNKNKAEKF